MCIRDRLPLVCTPHEFKFPEIIVKDIFISFVGTITDPIREEMLGIMPKDNPHFYCSTNPHSLEDYCRILARSKYVLCPRGKGYSSFRICEALQYGAIPVYIWDENKEIHGIDAGDDLGLIFSQINLFEAEYGGSKIKSDLQVILNTAEYANFHYNEYFTFDAVKTEILANL